MAAPGPTPRFAGAGRRAPLAPPAPRRRGTPALDDGPDTGRTRRGTSDRDRRDGGAGPKSERQADLIEQAMIFMLGVLVAGLLALLVLPAYARRAARLARRDIEARLPLTLEDFSAQRDAIRARFAAEAARLEMKAERLAEELAESRIAADGALAEADAMRADREDLLARVAEAEGRLEDLRAEYDRRLAEWRDAGVEVAASPLPATDAPSGPAAAAGGAATATAFHISRPGPAISGAAAPDLPDPGSAASLPAAPLPATLLAATALTTSLDRPGPDPVDGVARRRSDDVRSDDGDDAAAGDDPASALAIARATDAVRTLSDDDEAADDETGAGDDVAVLLEGHGARLDAALAVNRRNDARLERLALKLKAIRETHGVAGRDPAAPPPTETG